MALKGLVRALESPLGAALAEKLMVDAGLDAFRATSPGDADVTTVYPPLPEVDPGEALDAEALAARAAAAAPSSGELPTVAALGRAYRERRVDPQEVVRRLEVWLEGLESSDEPMGFFVSRKPEETLRDALESSRRLAAGEARSVLEGIPVVLKDAVDLAGHPTTLGTKFLTEPKVADSVVAQRLKAAGAVILGKANTHELGGLPDHHGFQAGAVHNPWRRGHATGGSSAGSAVAVAAGLCPVAIGTGGGGASIRTPAALCGVVGLKATRGRIPGVAAAARSWSAGQVGPLGLTVDDVAVAYALLAGPHPADPRTLRQPPPNLAGYDRATLAGLKVGHCEPLLEGVQPAVAARYREALQALLDAGASMVEVPLPDLAAVRWAHTCIILSELAETMLPHAGEPGRFGPEARLYLGLGRHLRATDLVHALRHRHRLTRVALEHLQRADVILTPTTSTTAPTAAKASLLRDDTTLPVAELHQRFTRFSALTGCPGLAVPAGYDDAGLPVSVHLMGRHYEEHLLFRVGRVVEARFERRVPEVYAKVL